jgi:ubiquinone/menaquinone biosynthesis C-methylase UbiE
VPSWKGRPAEFKKLWGYSVGFYGVWVAHVGRRMGLFERIAKKPVSACDLAAQAGLDAGAVRAWCSAAESLGLVKARGKKLHMTERMKEMMLDASSPDYLGGQFSHLALRSLDYGGLDGLFRSGMTHMMTPAYFEAIGHATDWDHRAFLSAIRSGRNKKLHLLLLRGCRLLDVGCGTGAFIEKLWQAYPRASFVGVEPSESAVHRAMDMAAGKPVQILRLRGEDMSFADEFDIVYLGESLYAASDRQAMASKCYRALKKGGTIAIVEGLLPDRVATDEDRLIMGMQLDFALLGHRFMTRKEIKAHLLRAGFARVAFQDLGGSVFLVTAEKR